MSNQNEPGSQVLAQAIPDDSFPDLETVDHDYLYIILANFIHKAVPIKGSELTIINGFNNRVASPEAPFIILQILQEQ
ncbi:unnamed protein product [Commensalibacter communis]|uniref:hypothetical protein n=1 Tax=Commensalibacter communis TaxID=2972786 RepID=UPI0022FFA01B|nr:hypothetical protein [Commensalibacter communis]CAI3952897.1 unnamed protein product [Commensalibacter communis]